MEKEKSEKKKENRTICTCPDTHCSRRGNCDACRAYHREKGNLPKCMRSNGQKQE